MKRSAAFVLRHRIAVLLLFVVLTTLSAFAATKVPVNYDMADYLPAGAPSAKALHTLKKDFDFSMPNARVSYPVDSVREALTIKAKLQAADCVDQVLWLDDMVDIHTPTEQLDQRTVETYLKDGRAMFQVSADTVKARDSVKFLRSVKDDCWISGQLMELASAQNAVNTEIQSITLFIIPIVFAILLISTSSWLQPFLFLLTIGVSVLLNLGSNLILGSVSFITQAVSGVLQLAVSMDYAIFLLNRYNMNRAAGMENKEAMAAAIVRSSVAIASSAATTFFGFLALLFMQFRIGADLGIVMAKGIVFSFLTVLLFLPALILVLQRPLDRLAHRPLLPNFQRVGKLIYRRRYRFVLLIAIILVPAFLAAQNNAFVYGMGNYPKGSAAEHDVQAIDTHFGQQQQISLLVPRGDLQKEQRLQNKLERIGPIDTVMSYVSMADAAIPQEVVSRKGLDLLVSPNYSHFILNANMAREGKIAFATVAEIRDAAKELYGDTIQMTGYPVVTDDMRATVRSDNLIVNGLAVLTIALTIAIAFRSLFLPILLVMTIEVAIWLNLSVPYFTGSPLSYIGFLIISTVQLGSTVDYAILYTEHYCDHRTRRNRRETLDLAARETIPSLLPPAMILTCSGLVLYLTSSLTIVSELGEVLARGAALSLLMVIFVLPGLLFVFDRLVERTSFGRHFMADHQNAFTKEEL
ncbi:efflux RND transporter permease subunit [Murdochiella vaginalis]|uniref:efflux RND transporter permease subunit n=1 Tax=Murdochiella vaginalis TaxID=1852373 RepID=UPI0008FDDE8D|nr:MMPL family transporter [Murdochiella vaginalis]